MVKKYAIMAYTRLTMMSMTGPIICWLMKRAIKTAYASIRAYLTPT